MQTKLLALFDRLSGRSQAYLEPTETYTNHMGAEVPHPSPHSDAQFIGDVIHLLDCPEQREAVAEAKFDYLAESARTASAEFQGHLASAPALLLVMGKFKEAADGLDHYKKLFFYGENPEKGIVRDPFILEHADGHALIDCLNADIETVQAQEILHAILGIASEGGELVDAVLKALLSDEPLDLVNLQEEAGDVMWYIALLLRNLGATLPDTLMQNIDKLRKRFPDKFTTDEAHNRDLGAEREVLERKYFKGDAEEGVRTIFDKN